MEPDCFKTLFSVAQDNRTACLLPLRTYNHFFHLKNMYGKTAANSIITTAIG
jgi:hypothetical protein